MDPLPALVHEAMRRADALAFPTWKDPDQDSSVLPAAGRLLAALAASKPGGRIAEAGSGCGVGTAWLAGGLRGGATLVTVEQDETRARMVEDLFAHRDDVTTLCGDSEALLPPLGPFDVLFVDGFGPYEALVGPRSDDLVAMVAPGGFILFDDVSATNTPASLGDVMKRRFFEAHPELMLFEFHIDTEWLALVASRG